MLEGENQLLQAAFKETFFFTIWEVDSKNICCRPVYLPVVTFPDENSESESDSDDRFKGKVTPLLFPRESACSSTCMDPGSQTSPGVWENVNRKAS